MTNIGRIFAISSAFALIAVPTFAAPISKTIPAKPSNSAPLQIGTIKAWKCEQTIPYGKITVYISPTALRIDGVKGGRLIANAPDWKVYLYNINDKTQLSFDFDHWMKHAEDRQMPISKSGVRPKKTTMAGLPALMYEFQMHGMGDSDDGFGSLYQSAQKQVPFKFRRFTIAEDIKKFPRQAIEIWRIHADVPIIGVLPLEEYDEQVGGRRIYSIKTLSQKYESVPPDFFSFKPKGYKKGGAPFSVFYGDECEDVTKMMLGAP